MPQLIDEDMPQRSQSGSFLWPTSFSWWSSPLSLMLQKQAPKDDKRANGFLSSNTDSLSLMLRALDKMGWLWGSGGPSHDDDDNGDEETNTKKKKGDPAYSKLLQLFRDTLLIDESKDERALAHTRGDLLYVLYVCTRK